MERGIAHARRSEHAEALADLLWCFDARTADVSFAAVRRSFLLSYIAEIGQTYEPALAALRERRDGLERSLDSETASEDDALDFAALNRVLDDESLTVAAYENAKISSAEPVRSALFAESIAALIDAKRYDEVVGNANNIPGCREFAGERGNAIADRGRGDECILRRRRGGTLAKPERCARGSCCAQSSVKTRRTSPALQGGRAASKMSRVVPSRNHKTSVINAVRHIVLVSNLLLFSMLACVTTDRGGIKDVTVIVRNLKAVGFMPVAMKDLPVILPPSGSITVVQESIFGQPVEDRIWTSSDRKCAVRFNPTEANSSFYGDVLIRCDARNRHHAVNILLQWIGKIDSQRANSLRVSLANSAGIVADEFMTGSGDRQTRVQFDIRHFDDGWATRINLH